MGGNKYCFILYNWEFSEASRTRGIVGYAPGQDNDLPGYKKDFERIHKTFLNLGFYVESHENAKTTLQMTSAVLKWLKDIGGDLSQAECIFVFILTHGANHGYLYACDGGMVHLDKLRTICQGKVPRGVPQLFFVQACRGDRPTGLVETNEVRWRPPDMDGASVAQKAGFKVQSPKFRDSLVYYATTEGDAAAVLEDGSLFVKKVCAKFDRFGKTHGLWEIITLINWDLSGEQILYEGEYEKSGQCPEAVFSLSKNVFFHSPPEPVHHTDELKLLKLKRCNPCYIFLNSDCSTHDVLCKQFDKDKKTVSETFRQLNFDVLDKYKSNNLKGMLKNARSLEENKDAECVVLVILSCGGDEGGGEDQGHFPVVYGSDGAYHSIDNIVREMNEGELADKTKLVFILLKRCAGKGKQFAKKCYLNPKNPEVEESVEKKKAFGTDTLIYYLVLEEENRTEFVTELCRALKDISKQGGHLGDVVYCVNKIYASSKKQVPEACSTLTKLVYLNYIGCAEQKEILLYYIGSFDQSEEKEMEEAEAKILRGEHVVTKEYIDIDNEEHWYSIPWDFRQI